MSDELILYTNPLSRGRTARWMLEEVGRPYEARILDFAGATKAPDYLALNPMGKVPTLVHGRTVVTESAAICAYLADAFPEAGLAPPPGASERGPYYRWLFFAAGPLEAAMTDRALGFVVTAERERTVGYGSFERALDALEGVLEAADYLAGDRFTAADLYVGAHVAYGLAFNMIPKRPAFELYAARVAARPAAKRAREIDDALAAELRKRG